MFVWYIMWTLIIHRIGISIVEKVKVVEMEYKTIPIHVCLLVTFEYNTKNSFYGFNWIELEF